MADSADASTPVRLTALPYRRAFSRPLATGRGVWRERAGVLVRLEHRGSGAAGYGEAAPLPEFGTEPPDQAWSFLERAQSADTLGAIDARIAAAPPAAGFALWAARWCLRGWDAAPAVRTAALLPLGPDTRDALAALRADGTRTFKLKLGRAESGRQWQWLSAVAAALMQGERLRLDPNRGWSRRDWAFWQPRLRDLAGVIEFVEEPFTADTDLLRMALHAPVPLALDESLAGGGAAIRAWRERGWPGYWIVKPALLGPAERWLELLAPVAGRVVISSAFETAIGMGALVALAARFPELDHGLGTQAYFADGLGAPRQGCRVAPPTAAQLEAAWTRLSRS